MTKRISASSFPKISSHSTVGSYAVVGVLGRFWEFIKKNAKKFSKELKDSEKRESEFIKAVERDSERWV